MDNAALNRYKDNLLNNLYFRKEYDESSGLKKKILLVEGATDKKFIDRIKTRDMRCISVAEFVQARNAFSTRQPSASVSHKEIIVEILKHLSRYPEMFDFPKGAEMWPLYGMVDNDFDESQQFAPITKLFFTDTHDLETLLIWSDESLLMRLDNCVISKEEINRALYLAGQFSKFRQAVYKVCCGDNDLPISVLNTSDGTVNFSAFTENDKISLSRLMDYANQNLGSEKLSPARIKKLTDKVSVELKKYIDRNGVWKKDISSFTAKSDDYWLFVNGHDILSAMRFVSANANTEFCVSGGFVQNRGFEFVLIEKYAIPCFAKTKLYEKLFSAELIICCERMGGDCPLAGASSVPAEC